MNSLRPEIDEQTGEYKTCPVCGRRLIWTLDYKNNNCTKIDCIYNDKIKFDKWIEDMIIDNRIKLNKLYNFNYDKEQIINE